MGFKDVVRSDIDRVFLNLQEFADEHQVQGEAVKCVIDTIETQESGSSDRTASLQLTSASTWPRASSRRL